MGEELRGGAFVPAAPVGAAPPTSLAPGFRFHPTDEELVQYYLKRKALGKPFRFQAVADVDVYKSEPWELADHSLIKSRDLEWYFFSPVDRKYGSGSRLNRSTGAGYWKATGKDRLVRHKDQTIGLKKTLVFHDGRAPKGERTDWIMHEYRLVAGDSDNAGDAQGKDAFILCRILQKSGLGPPRGDRYAPFVEEEWDDGRALVVPGADAGEEMVYNDYAQVNRNENDQGKAPLCSMEVVNICENVPYIRKRERSKDSSIADVMPFTKPKHSDVNNSYVNCLDDSTLTLHDLSISTKAKNVSSKLLEFHSLEPLELKEKKLDTVPAFDAASLEKSVPPGYLKFISNLENEVLNLSMEKEALTIEVMRAQAMINVLQSRIDFLDKENNDLRKRIQDM